LVFGESSFTSALSPIPLWLDEQAAQAAFHCDVTF
jgi:hypothetical protein